MNSKDKLIGTALILMGLAFIVLGVVFSVKANQDARRNEIYNEIYSENNNDNIQPNDNNEDQINVYQEPGADDSTTPNNNDINGETEGGTRYIY